MCADERHKNMYMYHDATTDYSQCSRCKFCMENKGSLENPWATRAKNISILRSNELYNGLSNFSPFHIFVY